MRLSNTISANEASSTPVVEKTTGSCLPAKMREPNAMATLPIAIGMITEVIPCFFSAFSCNSTVASSPPAATSATKAGSGLHQLSTTYAPSPTPIPIALGKLRPARPCVLRGRAGESLVPGDFSCKPWQSRTPPCGAIKLRAVGGFLVLRSTSISSTSTCVWPRRAASRLVPPRPHRPLCP